MRGGQEDDADGVPGNVDEVELGAEQLAREPAALGECRGYGGELCTLDEPAVCDRGDAGGQWGEPRTYEDHCRVDDGCGQGGA